MDAADTPMCLARVIRMPHIRTDTPPAPLTLAAEDGCWPVSYALATEDFQPGDLVEVRLVERCPEFGLQQWSAAARRG